MSTAEWSDPGFAARLGDLLRTTREARGLAPEDLASRGTLSVPELDALEHGSAPLDDDVIAEAVALYGADVGELVKPRRAIEIDIAGWISVGAQRRRFDPLDDTSLLTEYLSLVRHLRRQEREPVIALRRDDIEALAGFLCLPGQQEVERLATLMGLTQQRRRTMVAMFAAGAAVIGLGTASATLALGAPSGPVLSPNVAPAVAAPLDTGATTPPVSPVELLPPTPPDRVDDGTAPPAPLPLADVASAAGVIVAAPAASLPFPPPISGQVVQSVPAPPTPATEPTTVGDPPVPVVEAEPGRTVAVGLPPTPPLPGFDGDRVVAVGLPPVPPAVEPSS